MTSPVQGSRLSRQVCLRYVMRHPVAFREYFVPKVSRRRYWGRYTFSPVLMAMEQGDAALMAGRGAGKSFSVLEPELVRQSIARPGEETLLTSLRRIHVVDRMERVIDYFETVPILRLFRDRIVRSPSYTIMLRTGHSIFGICVDLASNVSDPTTGLIRELRAVSIGDSVVSCTPKGSVGVARVSDSARNGVRDVVRVYTESGRSVVLTPDHRLLTDEGWRPAESCYGLRIAVPASLPEPVEPSQMSPEQIDLLAILLAEGSLTPVMPEFYNDDPEIVRLALNGAQQIGCRMKRVVLKNGRTGRYTLGPRRRMWEWLEAHSVNRVTAGSKEIPPCVFRLDRAQLARFLSVLWMTDGHVNTVNGPMLHMASERFVRQVQHLLLRIGVQSRVVYQEQPRPNRAGCRDSWVLTVYSSSWERFSLTVPLWGNRRQAMSGLLEKPHRANGVGWPRADAVAKVMLPAWENVRKRTRTQSLKQKWKHSPAWIRGHLASDPIRLRGPERLRFMRTANPERIMAWAETAGCDHEMLPFWTSGEIWWDPVVLIERAGRSEVGDVSIPPHRNFVANDIIVHNSVGDDPEARMAQGKHASTLVIEEAQQYPDRAWLKLQGAKDPRGCRVLMAGVPDGRLDTPFRRADGRLTAFKTRRFHLSRRHDPYFDQKTKREFIDTLGGEEQDTFMQEVDAEWGHPVWSAWDLDAIYRCVEPQLPVHVVQVSGKLYRQQGLTPAAVCADLPGSAHPGAPVMISMDVGYSQPSEIGVWEWWHDRWWLIARVRLVNRMEHDDQAAILDALATLYGAGKVGIDTTEGEGRAIAHTLEAEKGWKERIVRVTFTETFLSGWTPTGEEVWEHARSIGTRTLRGLFSHKTIALPPDENIPMEFNQEREARNSDGSTKVITPPTVHITDMMRVLAVMVFLETPLIPPDAETGGFADLEWGDRPSPWAPATVGF